MYSLVKVDSRLMVDVVEDQLLPLLELNEVGEVVGEAPTLDSVKKLARKKGLTVRRIIQQPDKVSEKLAVYLIKAAEERGMDRNKVIAALLPLMTQEARKRYLS